MNRVSAFQEYQFFSDVIAERPKPASENSEPIRNRVKLSDCVSGMMIRLNEESEWVHQVVRYMHSPAWSSVNSDFDAGKNRIVKKSWRDWNFNLRIWQKAFLVNKNLHHCLQNTGNFFQKEIRYMRLSHLKAALVVDPATPTSAERRLDRQDKITKVCWEEKMGETIAKPSERSFNTSANRRHCLEWASNELLWR